MEAAHFGVAPIPILRQSCVTDRWLVQYMIRIHPCRMCINVSIYMGFARSSLDRGWDLEGSSIDAQ